MERLPNIVLITTDQHRADSVGFMGNPHVRTPHLDALAGEGLVVEECHVTSPVCAPSRASLWTGRYPHLHGQLSNGFGLAGGEVKWWQLLAGAGYRTAAIGKMHAEPWDHPLDFHDRIVIEGKDWLYAEDEYARFLRAHGYGFNRPRDATEVRGLHWCFPRLSPVPTEHHIDTFIADRVVEYLRSAAGDERPLALWASFCSPHHPLDPPQEYADRYTGMPVPAHVLGPDEPHSKTPEQVENWRWNAADEVIRQRSWRYYWATVELVDDQVGRVVDALRETGRFDDALVVFTADHGEMLWQHGLFDKAFYFYDDAVRVPTFVRWPGHVAPGRYGGLTESIDLVPVLLSAAGVAVPARMNARNVLEAAQGRAAPRDSVLSQHFDMRMLRTGDAKLVVYGGCEYGELYDLQSDPQELRNLWGDSGAADLRRRLERRLIDRLIESADPAYRILARPTNKGAYHSYLAKRPRLAARYLPRA